MIIDTFFPRLLTSLFMMASITMTFGQNVYLSEASRKPFNRVIIIDSIGEVFRYTAFYTGSISPEKDIHVEFSIDESKVISYNQEMGMEYKILPKESYSLSIPSAKIPKGSVSAKPGNVKVVGTSGLKPFKEYLLPVTVKIKNGNIKVDSELSTIYYLIKTVPSSKDIQQKQIGKLPTNTKTVFGFRDKYLIAVNENGDLTSYEYSSEHLSDSALIEGSQLLTGMDNIINFRDHHLVALDRETNGGQLHAFPISDKATKISPMTKIFGTAGYGDFSEIIPFKNNLYCLSPSRVLKVYPLTDSLEWKSQGIRSLGSGWDFLILFGYNESLIAIDNEGNMWEYPLLVDGQLGLAKKTGMGFEMYEKMVPLGNTLLGIDKGGTVWKIKFNRNQ